MKKIFIFENSNSPHESSVVSAIKIFSSLGFRIVLCLNKKSYSRLSGLLDLTNIEVIHINRWNGLIKFIMQYHKKDYTLFNTVALRGVLTTCMASLLSKNRIYYLRNINSWLQKPSLDGIAFRYRILGIILFFVKQRLIGEASYLVVGSFNMKHYLTKKINKSVLVIPFSIFNKDNINKDNINKDNINKTNNKFTFVVPGTIDLKRKDLSLIRDAMYLFSKNDLSKFKLILLGRPISEDDNTFVKNWKSDMSDSLIYYSEFIDDNEFNMVLKNADIIMGVLNINFQNKYGNQEIYGLTKDTGVEAHAISYAKPLFINFDYQVDANLDSTTIQFNDINDCYLKMRCLINKEITFDSRELLSNSNNYEIDFLTKMQFNKNTKL
jgi:hypothetical protein